MKIFVASAALGAALAHDGPSFEALRRLAGNNLGDTLGEPTTVEKAWWADTQYFCDFGMKFLETTDGTEYFDCASREAYYTVTDSSLAPNRATCEAKSQCFQVDGNSGTRCGAGGSCVWKKNQCHCLPDDECSYCKVPTPAPTVDGHCGPCDNSLGYGVENSDGECICDVRFFEGTSCEYSENAAGYMEAGSGTSPTNSGLIAVALDECQYDSMVGLYRKVSCLSDEKAGFSYFSDAGCEMLVEHRDVEKDTCYAPSGNVVTSTPTPNPTEAPIDTAEPTSSPTQTPEPTLAPVDINYEDCDVQDLDDSLRSWVYATGDIALIDSCESLLTKIQIHTDTQYWLERTHEMCSCIGRIPDDLRQTAFNCQIAPDYHGYSVHHLCDSIVTVLDQRLYGRRRSEDTVDFTLLNLDATRQGPVTMAGENYVMTWNSAACADPTAKPTAAPTEVPTSSPTDLPPPAILTPRVVARRRPYVCAKEGEFCRCDGMVFFGRRFVRGKPGRGRQASFRQLMTSGFVRYSGSVECSREQIGTDPMPGFRKQCYCVPPRPTSQELEPPMRK